MDSLERRELLRNLGWAIDGSLSAITFFFEAEVRDFLGAEKREPQSPLYETVAAFEILGFDVADIYYADDGKSIVVEHREEP